jgi:uncharacterized protein YpuA (DUF1002 family)
MSEENKTKKKWTKKRAVVVVVVVFCLVLSLAYIVANVYFNNNMGRISQHSGEEIERAQKEALKMKF